MERRGEAQIGCVWGGGGATHVFNGARAELLPGVDCHEAEKGVVAVPKAREAQVRHAHGGNPVRAGVVAVAAEHYGRATAENVPN